MKRESRRASAAVIVALLVLPFARAAAQDPVTAPPTPVMERLVILPAGEPAPRNRPQPDAGRSRRWDAFLGPRSVPEADFYRMVGREALARSAQRARRNRLIALGVGATGMLVGTALFTSSHATGKERPTISVSHLVGGFLIPIGGMTVGLSIMTLPMRRVPLAMAEEFAGEYNRVHYPPIEP